MEEFPSCEAFWVLLIGNPSTAQEKWPAAWLLQQFGLSAACWVAEEKSCKFDELPWLGTGDIYSRGWRGCLQCVAPSSGIFLKLGVLIKGDISIINLDGNSHWPQLFGFGNIGSWKQFGKRCLITQLGIPRTLSNPVLIAAEFTNNPQVSFLVVIPWPDFRKNLMFKRRGDLTSSLQRLGMEPWGMQGSFLKPLKVI